MTSVELAMTEVRYGPQIREALSVLFRSVGPMGASDVVRTLGPRGLYPICKDPLLFLTFLLEKGVESGLYVKDPLSKSYSLTPDSRYEREEVI